MKESARIALSYVRANREHFGIPAGADRRAVHVHFPAGATPKDGPSAGIAMTTALVSLFTGRPVKSTLAMTGEVTLQGHVLPIGGVKQKVMAAHRVGIREVILPLRNEPDIDDVPEHIRDELDDPLRQDRRRGHRLGPRARGRPRRRLTPHAVPDHRSRCSCGCPATTTAPGSSFGGGSVLEEGGDAVLGAADDGGVALHDDRALHEARVLLEELGDGLRVGVVALEQALVLEEAVLADEICGRILELVDEVQQLLRARAAS